MFYCKIWVCMRNRITIFRCPFFFVFGNGPWNTQTACVINFTESTLKLANLSQAQFFPFNQMCSLKLKMNECRKVKFLTKSPFILGILVPFGALSEASSMSSINCSLTSSKFFRQNKIKWNKISSVYRSILFNKFVYWTYEIKFRMKANWLLTLVETIDFTSGFFALYIYVES